MSNTLKFGNGEWYGKKDTILAYNDENSNFKPLPFSFDRASSATVVNKDGLIETVGSGEPRVDYKDDAKGALLLEPTRSNIWTNSNLSASITFNGLTRTLNQTVSPSGNNDATLFNETATTGTHRFYRLDIPSTSTDFSMSFFAKKNGINIIRTVAQGGTKFADFNLSLGTVSNESGINSSTIEDYGNGWYRCIINVTASGWVGLYTLNDSSQNSYLGNVSKGVYLYGAQLEQGSYATSYIPTQGGVVTRVAETSSQTVPSGVIGQTEGTMFIDGIINGKNSSVNRRIFTISNGTSSTAINIQTPAQDSKLEFEVTNGGATQVFISADNNSLVYGQNFKAAFAYKSNDFVAYINGVQIGTDTNGTVPTCEKVSFDRGNNTSNFEGSVNQAKLYSTRLSNAELQALTSN